MSADEAVVQIGPALLLLGFEAQQVIGLRWLRLAAGGPDAYREAQLMVHEKMLANGDAAIRLYFGRLPSAVVDDYRTIVRANIKRLTAEGVR